MKNNDSVRNIGIGVSTSIHVIIRIQFKLYKFCLKYTLQYILVGLNSNFFIMHYNYVTVLRITQLYYKAFILNTNNLVQIIK